MAISPSCSRSGLISRERETRLDVMMVRNPDNTITTDVFRKETHTDHYLQWSSNHPVQQKLGIVRTLMHRANTLIEDPALREAEKEKVRVALRHCGYPEWALREGENNSRKDKSSKEQSKTGKQEQLPASYVVLPYIHGVTERLKRVYAKHNVSLYSKPGFTLRNALVRPKDPLAPGEKCGVIYKIKCEECGEVYVGETERSLGERTSEHQKSLHQKDCKSALSQHQLQAGHNITTRPISDIIEIIDQESRNPHRKIKEAVHIQLEGAKLNRTEGWELPKTYLPLLRREATGGGTRQTDASLGPSLALSRD
ncbi:hypothetical protein Bbelb_155680 [Branchiostoma belcheri]|nr:hypothetical protein Bbelb_155680 [Branchiostoma belcheri]